MDNTDEKVINEVMLVNPPYIRIHNTLQYPAGEPTLGMYRKYLQFDRDLVEKNKITEENFNEINFSQRWLELIDSKIDMILYCFQNKAVTREALLEIKLEDLNKQYAQLGIWLNAHMNHNAKKLPKNQEAPTE